MNFTDPKSWGELVKQIGVVSAVLIMVIVGNGFFIYTVFKDIPTHLEAISNGYHKNAVELNKGAEKFAGAALGILQSYKVDRLADRQAMIELIRAGDLDSSQVADAFEEAAEKSAARPAPLGTHLNPDGTLK